MIAYEKKKLKAKNVDAQKFFDKYHLKVSNLIKEETQKTN
jgi:hypothetical protein